ncbi:MAG: SET domain-containing protein-lysine N-methyltransferase [Gammaproteobacteria bacterium]|nr:SET domain-containing protein-lysine N-methyltransferase [Gammaproteobacteria bacterium]
MTDKTGTKWEREHFIVDDSTIECAGKGLFAKVEVGPGDTIGPYTGMVMTDDEVNSPPYVDSDYVLWICKDHNIVGEGPKANYVRFINHHDEPNCHIVVSTRWKKARIEAIKHIQPGEELFIDYGPEYWENFEGYKSPEKPMQETMA